MSNCRLALAGMAELNSARHKCRSALRESAGSADKSGSPGAIEPNCVDALVIETMSFLSNWRKCARFPIAVHVPRGREPQVICRERPVALAARLARRCTQRRLTLCAA